MELREIKKTVKSLDKNVNGNSNVFKVAVIVLSCAFMKQTNQVLTNFTGYDFELVKKTLRNLRKNKVIKNGKVHCKWDKEEERIGILGGAYKSGFEIQVDDAKAGFLMTRLLGAQIVLQEFSYLI